MEVLWECKRNPALSVVVEEVELMLEEEKEGPVGWAKGVVVWWQERLVSESVKEAGEWWCEEYVDLP